MAGSTQLILKFGTLNGEKTWTFKNLNVENVTTQQIKTLMDTMITNGSIYKYPPLTKVSARARTITDGDYDLSD